MPLISKQQPPYYSATNSNPITTILTDDQIKALPTTPIQIIPAPGQNKMIVIDKIAFISNATGGAYTNLTPVSYLLYFGDEDYPMTLPNPGTLGDASQIYVSIVYPDTQPDDFTETISSYNNKEINLFLDNPGNLTGGNASNTLTIKTYYTIINL